MVTVALVIATGVAVTPAAAAAWKFGVIADTQWTIADDGKNPNTCAADIIKQINQQFINQGVKVVIAVGDTVDRGSQINIDTRALYAQDLYNAGIGFYPLRGNHEAAENPDYLTSGTEFRYAFPQIGTGTNNATPSGITAGLIPVADFSKNPPAATSGAPFIVGNDFSEPTTVNRINNSVSYSFDYNNVRFILLDQFDTAGHHYHSTISQQQPWINSRLTDARRPPHAIVFTHKNLLGGNHKDNLFGGPADANDPGDAFNPANNSKQVGMDAFITALADNGVRYCISGHDHQHYQALVKAPLTAGKSVQQLIGQSASSKFYKPVAPFSTNDVPIAQELDRIGYYIFQVNAATVTVDYYASDINFPQSPPFATTPALNFVKRASFGYSLNGREFLVAPRHSYTVVQDNVPAGNGFVGTRAQILAGTNTGARTTNTGRPLTKAVNTGWAPAESGLGSDVFHLWGLAEIGTNATDVVALALTFTTNNATVAEFASGLCGLATPAASGSNWIRAVDANIGGKATFVFGPWQSSYGLGTYGVDTNTRTAWAVVNHAGEFAIKTK